MGNKPIKCSKKETGSSVISLHFYTPSLIERRLSFYHNCAHSKIVHMHIRKLCTCTFENCTHVAKYCLILILFRIAKRSKTQPYVSKESLRTIFVSGEYFSLTINKRTIAYRQSAMKIAAISGDLPCNFSYVVHGPFKQSF